MTKWIATVLTMTLLAVTLIGAMWRRRLGRTTASPQASHQRTPFPPFTIRRCNMLRWISTVALFSLMALTVIGCHASAGVG